MPPVHPSTVSQYSSLVIKSRLMSADSIQSMQSQWKSSGGIENDVTGFRRLLVQERHLTEYQSALLNRGHTEGYFLGEYTIIDLIGKGRMAGVYKAVHRSGQIVAIKVLAPSKAREGQYLARFIREAKLLIQLNHPNIVRAFEIGQSGGRHFIVMEALDGDPLDEILQKRKRLAPLESLRIVDQVLQGLQHLQDKGMVHRDLKPANLMLCPSPAKGEDTLKCAVKILDIGLGRSTFEEIKPESEPVTQITGENVILGTPDYLAPEQARNAHTVDIRADIYSLGCTLFHCLTGEPPFPDTNVLTQVLRHATETPRPLLQFLPSVPAGLQEVLNFMLAKDPAQRYPSPARASQAIEPLLKSIPQQQRQAEPVLIQPNYQEWLDAQSPTGVYQPLPTQLDLGIAPEANQASRTTLSSDQPLLPSIEEAEIVDLSQALADLPRTISTEYDVEVVVDESVPVTPATIKRVSSRKASTIPEPKVAVEPERQRGLLELNRRDFLMMGIGGAGVLFAILTGYGLAQMARRVPDEEPKETISPKSNDSDEPKPDKKEETKPKSDPEKQEPEKKEAGK